ncbi:MAG: endonuclease VII domain-containing protein [Acidobacterium ailaaui]|nr:endonuclease VII domain-containing protein [Pseudacidobacterium ailaaui]
MTSRRVPVCVDCIREGVTTRRPAPYGGPRSPRCATHHRAQKKARKDAAWARHLWKTYHITPEQYDALYEAQGGRCYICQRASGRTKRLAVDHDHSCCPGPTSCGKCIRGLLCTTDNRWLGHIRDDPRAARRAMKYLVDPPAKAVLGI